MATIVNVSNVKAADPGLGFDLQFNPALNDTLKVVVTIQNTYSSVLTINNPVADQTVACVVPFGDGQYNSGAGLSFQIDVYSPNSSPRPMQSISGCAMADPGAFKFNSNLPSSIPDGQALGPGNMMNSMDGGSYIGYMQLDGNFCVYKKYALNNSSLQNTDSTYSDVGANNCSLRVQNGRIFIYNSSTGSNISASPANQAMPGASMVINTQGMICLMLSGGTPVQVQVRPGNL